MTRRLLVLAAATCALTVAGADLAAATTPLSSLVVAPKAVGSGYARVVFPGFDSLSVPTLRYCGKNLPSDKSRAARIQESFQPAKKSQPFLSEEVVRYHAGGLAAVRRDLAKARTLCASSTRIGSASGGVVTETVKPGRLTGLPKGAIVLTDTFATVGGSDPRGASTTYSVFLIKGSYLIAVYGGSGKAEKAATVKLAKLAAARLATA